MGRDMPDFPEELYDFAFIFEFENRIAELALLAEPEDWGYHAVPSEKEHPVLSSFIRYTYKRLVEQGLIYTSNDAQKACFNTGLVTPNQEEIFALFDVNRRVDAQPWRWVSWCKKSDHHLGTFEALPDLASYFEDPSKLVFDIRKELRYNVDHIILDNRERFPAAYSAMNDYQLQTFLVGAIENAKKRVRRNYKTAIPQYYRGRVQLLLPLCISNPSTADLALVVEEQQTFYRASTCLTLSMAYNNARQLARPERDWLQP